MTERDYPAWHAFFARELRRPFAWESNDCVRFAARSVAALTGRRLLGGLRWRSLRQAERLLAERGGLEAAVDALLQRIPPALAQRGDVAGVADDRFGVRLMIVEGATLAGPGPRGIKRLPRSEMVMAWSATDPIGGADE